MRFPYYSSPNALIEEPGKGKDKIDFHITTTMSGKPKHDKALLLMLKSAKREMDNEDYDECISICNDIIKKDKKMTLAYMFKGKSLLEKKIVSDAIKCFIISRDLEPENKTCWKGLLTARKLNSEFIDFFTDLLGFAKHLRDNNDELTEVVILIKDYVEHHSLKFQPFHIFYLKQIIPGLSELGDIIGYQVDNPCVSLKSLIKIVETNEQSRINKDIQDLKKTLALSLSSESKTKRFNEKKWQVYSVSEIPQYYELLINLEQNDAERYKIQDLYLKYKYEMFLSANTSKDKVKLMNELKDMIDGLILINCPSEIAWKLYFDWYDPRSLSDLELDKLSKFIELFGKDSGYGKIFYYFLVSDISPFEKEKIVDYLAPKSKKTKKRAEKKKKNVTEEQTEEEDQHKDTQQQEIKKDDEKLDKVSGQRHEMFNVEPQEIFTNMYVSLKNLKFNSLICCRIVLDYSIHLKDYSLALDIATETTKLLAKPSHIGLDFSNMKIEQSLNLAIIYTYHEAPKNYAKALAFYANVERKDPDNIKVKVGKALILFETNRIEEAAEIFLALMAEYPNDIQAIQKYGWCQIKLQNFEEGRTYLQKALDLLLSDENSNKTSNALEVVSTLYYEFASSYYQEVEELGSKYETSTIKTLITLSSKYLVKCLKLSPNFVSAYTLSGLIYFNYRNDKENALKWFSKAFQLDPSEIEAAYQLVEYYTSINDWEMAEAICKGIIDNDTAKRKLNSVAMQDKSHDNSWHYRVLGCAAMEYRDDSKAIEYFQMALRMNPNDHASWIGLGEAYTFRGRIEASIKVFQHVIRLQSGVKDVNNNTEITPEMEANADLHAISLYASSLSMIFEFDQSVRLLTGLLNRREIHDKLTVQILMVQTLVLRCQSEIKKGAILKASDSLLELFSHLFDIFETHPKVSSSKVWKVLGDALTLSLTIQSVLPKLDIGRINSIFKNINTNISEDELISDLGSLELDVDDLIEKRKYSVIFFYFLTLSTVGAYLLNKTKNNKILTSSLIYNISISTTSWYKYGHSEKLKEVSVKLLKKSIELENNNPEYWNSLGAISLIDNPKISQHCFIKALAIEPKSAQYWFNLGLLYTHYSDYELAKNCFAKTQSIEPASSLSWIGFAIIADYEEDQNTARNLFTHSFVLSNETRPQTTLLYAVSVMETIMSEEYDERNLDPIQQLTSAHYGMMNYLKLFPEDSYALDLTISIIERLYSYESGIKYSESLCEILEREYEDTENESILINYASAKCQLSRLLLASGRYKDSEETCEEIGSLLDSVEDLNIQVQKCIMSCFTVLGLSFYFQGNFDKSLDEFQKLLSTFPDNKRIVILISQVLYEMGGEEETQAAMDELMNFIGNYGTSIVVALTLGAISISENLEDYILAVKEVLDQLSLTNLIADTHKEVPQMLTAISHILNKKEPVTEKDTRESKIWQRNAFMFPGDCESWKHLSEEVTLELSVHSNVRSAMEVSDAYVNVGRMREIQRGVLLSGGVSPAAIQSLLEIAQQQ